MSLLTEMFYFWRICWVLSFLFMGWKVLRFKCPLHCYFLLDVCMDEVVFLW